MHFAFLVESYDPARGGAERATLAMAEAIRRAGHSATVFAPADRIGGAPGEGLVAVPIKASGRAARARALAEALPATAKAELGPDVITVGCGKVGPVDVHWPHGGIHAVALRRSTAAGRSAVRGFFARGARALRPTEAVFREIEEETRRRVFDGRCLPMAISKLVQEDMATAYGRPPCGVPLLRNGAPIRRLRPPSPSQKNAARADLAARYGLPKDALWIAFVAMNPRLKGAALLLAALAKTRAPAIALFIGKPPSSRPPVNARYLGPVDEPSELLAAADLLAHPTHYDPCSLVTLEAMALGMAIVTSSQNGAAELLEHGQSGLIVPKKLAVLAQTFDRLAAAPELRRALGEAARKAAEKWGCDKAATRFLTFVKNWSSA